MALNPDLILRSAEAQEFLSAVQERLALAEGQGAALSIVGLRIEDHGGTAQLPAETRERLLTRAQTLIKRAVRVENDARRRVTDAVFHLEDVFFVVLFSANERTYLVPVGRIIESLRQEVYHTGSMAGVTYTRTLFVGSYTWLPSHGQLTPEMVLGRVLEASLMAGVQPQPDPHTRLGLNVSPFDEIKLYEYPWAQPRRKASRSEPLPATPARKIRTAAPTPAPQDEGRAWWQFWKSR